MNIPNNSSGETKAEYVHSMFSRIAAKYDFLNQLMTFGQDIRWRRQAIQLLSITSHEAVLDIGSGTGDFSREALRSQPAARVISADFNLAMMRAGHHISPLSWVNADALQLPFADSAFNKVVNGFLLRNVADPLTALREMYRVLIPGGKLVILETTPPGRNILYPFIIFYLRVVIPLLGNLFAGNSKAYQYLPASSIGFSTAEQLAQSLTQVGFKNVGYLKKMFGTVAIHWGEKDSDE